MSRMDSIHRLISRVALSAGLLAAGNDAVHAHEREIDDPPTPRQSEAIHIVAQATGGGNRDSENVRTINLTEATLPGLENPVTSVIETYRQQPRSERNSSEFVGDLFAEWGVLTAEVAGTLEEYHFRPLDPFPESDYQKQYRYLSEATVFGDFAEFVSPEQLDLHFYVPGDVLVLPNQYNIYVFSHDEQGNAQFVDPRADASQPTTISLDDIKTIPIPVDGQILLVNIPELRNFQQRARSIFETDNSPEREPTAQLPQTVSQYGNYSGNGFGFRNSPEDNAVVTVEGTVDRVFERHEAVEAILGQEGQMSMHFDLTFVNSDGLIVNYDQNGNSVGDTEDFINALLDRAEQEGRQIDFSINIRVPENWHIDDIQQFITDFYGPSHAYLSDAVRIRMGDIGLSIDPELPGTEGLGGTPLTYADINNLFATARLAGMTGRFGVYDVGVTPADGYLNTRNIQSNSPVDTTLHPEIGFISMGIGSAEDKKRVIESRANSQSLGIRRFYAQMMFYEPISPYLAGNREADSFSDPESFISVLQPIMVDGVPVSLEYVALQ